MSAQSIRMWSKHFNQILVSLWDYWHARLDKTVILQVQIDRRYSIILSELRFDNYYSCLEMKCSLLEMILIGSLLVKAPENNQKGGKSLMIDMYFFLLFSFLLQLER